MDHWEPSASSRTQITCASVQATTYTRHRQVQLLWCHERVYWRVEWRSVVFSDESTFCLYASNGHTLVRRRRSLWASSSGVHSHTTRRPYLRLHDVVAITYNSRSHLVYLQDKVNSARYITQVVNPVLLPFLRQEGDMLFQQDNAHPHMAAATQRALRGVQQLPWPARSPDLSPNEHVWDMVKWELTLSPEPAAIIAELRQRVQEARDDISQEDIRHLYGCLNARIHACIDTRRDYTVYLCDYLGTPYCDMCFIWYEFIIYSYNDKLLVVSIFYTMFLRVLHFLRQCILTSIDNHCSTGINDI